VLPGERARRHHAEANSIKISHGKIVNLVVLCGTDPYYVG
jgi:hypothetical protein